MSNITRNGNNVIGYVSQGNSSQTPLGGGATFTGAWEDISKFGSLSIIGSSDQVGTLYAEFSIDGVTEDRILQLSDGTSSSFDIQPLIPVAQYFRVRVVNGATPQTSFRLQVLYSESARIAIPTSRANQGLNEYVPVLNARTIISDETGQNNAIVTDHKALTVTQPSEGKAAFGEQLFTELSPIIELQMSSFVNTDVIYTKENQSGTITHENNMAKLSTGAAANSGAELESKNNIRYLPGIGVRTRFTSVFTTGVANSTQGIGVGNEGDGFFFGYDGEDFGVLHRRYGIHEVRTLTVTTGSSHAENITITLDSDADATVAVTNTGDVTLTANEIAAHDYSDVGKGWDAYAVGDKVVFVSWSCEVQTGTYSLSGATSAVGTFAQTVAGVVPTDTWILQTAWNGDDIFDGNGITGVTLDPTKGNVYQIAYQWLGYGAIYFYVEDPDDGEMHLVHTIEYANANTRPSLGNPSMPLTAFVRNTSNTSDIVLRTGSLAAFNDGKSELIGPRKGIEGSIVLGATAAETPITTIRCKETFKGTKNRGEIKILLVGTSVEHSKPVAIKFYANATLTGASFSEVGANSMAQQDTSATAFTGGIFLFAIELGKTGNQVVNLSEDEFAGRLTPGGTITATIAPKSGNQAEANVGMNFVELY